MQKTANALNFQRTISISLPWSTTPKTDEELIVDPDFQYLERQIIHDQLNPIRCFTTLGLDDVASEHILSVREGHMDDKSR